MSRHWSDEDLVNKLYGIAPGDSHLEECAECRSRWLEVKVRRKLALESPEIAPEFLVAQREAIHRRIEGSGSGSWAFRLTPALAALSVVVLGIMLSQPTPAPQPTIASNDSDFYTEIYAMVESPEPWAAEPMYGLFED